MALTSKTRAGLLIVITGSICCLALVAGAQTLSHPQAGTFAPDDFTEPTTCAMCHTLQHAQWQNTMHNLSTVDPYYRRTVQLAAADVPGVEQFCEACHSPIAVLTGQDPLGTEPLTGAADFGTSCDFCHTVSACTHIGNGGFESSPGITKYGPFGSVPKIYHKVQLSPLHDSAEICGICHQVAHPINGLVLENTYDEFLAGPYPAEGFKCQTCHMTPGLTHFEAFPGPIANSTEQREHIWTHLFAGGNTFVPELLGYPEIAGLARARLAKAATLAIEPPVMNDGELSFTVAVTNSGAGHRIPTGVTEERQIWLEIVVRGADGTELAHFGQLSDAGDIPDDTLLLGTVFGDAAGQPTHRIWLAESVLSDRRIAPRETERQPYTVPVGAQAPARIEVTLWYRSSHQNFIDVLFADTPEREVVPREVMAEASIDL